MGLTRSICRTRAILVALVVLACIALSTWAVVARYEPRAKATLDHAIGKYDVVMPEVTIKGGKASIKEKQPYYINDDPKKGPVIVIDTREETRNQAQKLLDNVKEGAALTRDLIIIKDSHETRMVPLAHIPDLTLNSQVIKEFSDRYYPSLVLAGTGLVGIWYIFAKLVQILIFALLFYLAAKRIAGPPTYGQSFKVAAFAMIPPVVLHALLARSDASSGVMLGLYFGVYILSLVLAYWNLAGSPPEQGLSEPAITP